MPVSDFLPPRYLFEETLGLTNHGCLSSLAYPSTFYYGAGNVNGRQGTSRVNFVQELLILSANPASFPLRLKLHGCRADLIRELPQVYPDVWRLICNLSTRSHISIDIENQSILQRGAGGWHPLRNPEVGDDLMRALRVINRLPNRELTASEDDLAVIILAGGTGSRFADGSSQKVLHPVARVPALERSLNTCREAGAGPIVLVVGYRWDEVFDFTERHAPDCHYVYQPRAMGTGDAARRATWLLRSKGFEGTVLILAGDKVLSRQAIPAMIETHKARQADMTLAAAGKSVWPNSGRVVMDGRKEVLSVIERPDVIQRQMFRRIFDIKDDIVDTDELLTGFRLLQPSEKKLRKALGSDLWNLLSRGGECPRVQLAALVDPGQLVFRLRTTDGNEFEMTPEAIEDRCDLVNVSLYLFSSEALYWAMDRLESLNAQGEFYLTDAAEILAQSREAPRRYRVCAARLPDDYDAAGFNTLEELADIEEHMKRLGTAE